MTRRTRAVSASERRETSQELHIYEWVCLLTNSAAVQDRGAVAVVFQVPAADECGTPTARCCTMLGRHA
jgi:hypothetical protein